LIIKIDEEIVERRFDTRRRRTVRRYLEQAFCLGKPVFGNQKWHEIKRIAQFGEERQSVSSPSIAKEITLQFGYPRLVAPNPISEITLRHGASLARHAQLFAKECEYRNHALALCRDESSEEHLTRK
jgi:hypothetical protein